MVYGVWSVQVMLRNFITTEHCRYGSMEDHGVSTAEYLVHLVCMNRICACREFCVHSWQREWHKMQGWCESVVVSFPSSSVGFLGFHPYMHLFSFRKLFVTCSCYFFFVVCLYCCLGMEREKRGGRGGQGEDAWSIKLIMFTYN